MTRAADEAKNPVQVQPKGPRSDNLTAHRHPPGTGGPGGRALSREDGRRELSPEAVDAILNVASLDMRDYAMILLAYAAPLRVGELCALKVGDAHLPVDGAQCYVRVASSKRSCPRALPVPAHAAAALRRYLADRGEAGAGDPLFAGRGGRPMSPTGFGLVLRRHAEAAGRCRPDLFEGVRVTPTDLRRSMVSQLFAREVGLGVISRHISCPTSPSTLDYYLRLPGDAKGGDRR